MKNYLLKLKILTLLLFSGTAVLAQLSPSGQIKIETPSILSACASDTIWMEVTNTNGPTCNSGVGPPELIQVSVSHPSGGSITYQSGTVDSDPGGALEVAYASNTLDMTVPAPSFGATTRFWFVLNSTCNVTDLNPLPSLDVSATYPASFSTGTETWTSAQMNTGIGQITFIHASSTQKSVIAGFSQNLNYAGYVTNTGFGKITEVTYHQIVHDSLVPYYNNGVDHIYLRRRQPSNLAPISKSSALFDDYQVTNLGNGYRYYSVTFKGATLDSQDGQFDPGDQLQINASYLRTPETCIGDMEQKQWVTYKCVGGGDVCAIPDTLYRTVKISAGTPIVGAQNSTIEEWDGCTEKTGSFTFKNTGVGDPNIPEQSVAYDVNLSLSLSGKLTVDNLTLAGVTTIASTPATPANTSLIEWNIKDQLTVDPDGPGGLDDLDGDGYFDDIKPGDSVDVTFTYTVDCDLACGADLYYDIKGISSFTDFCRKLDAKTTTPIYEFGFKQTAPVAQITPLPDYGVMGQSETASREASYSFNYQAINLNTSLANATLRINYSKTMTIHEPITFMGTSLTLADFTQVGAGSLDTTTYNNTADVDSALEYTLTAAQMALLFDNVADNLTYQSMHISCDSFQNQNNKDTWQLLFQINNDPCPAPNVAPPCAVDLACSSGFAYNINEGCGVKPCYIVKDSLFRESPHGYVDEEQTATVVPTAAGTSHFYEGDTLTYRRSAILSGDYPQMEPTGSVSGTATSLVGEKGFYSYFSFSYNKDPQTSIYDLDEPAYEFIPTISRLKIYDTTTNTLLYDVPLEYKHFYGWISGFGSTQNRDVLTLADNITNNPAYAAASNSNSTPGTGLGDYWCHYGSWPIDPANCPFEDARYRTIGSIMYWAMQNEAKNRVSESYYLYYERALKDAGVVFDPGFTKYRWEIDTKWRVNPDYPHTNAASLLTRGAINRIANGVTPPPGTRMGSCGTAQGTATAVTKFLEVNDGGKTYRSVCGLTICNDIFYQSQAGNFFDGEIRLPFMMDSFTVDLPAEYHLTAQPTFTGTANGTTNAIQAAGPIIGGGISGHVLFTNNQANSGTPYTDFPRFNDADGNSTVWSTCYPISNAGSDNFITETYAVPVTYYTKDEFGNQIILIDTFYITEADPAITIAPLGGAVQIEDGGACSYSYMDVLVLNNTIYAVGNVFLAAESNPNATIVDMEDAPNEVPANPITGNDKNFYGPSTNNLYAELGGMAAGGRRIVRVYFSTTACSDSLKIFSNFGCNYPLTQQPEYSSPTLDSSYIVFNSVSPGMMSGPLDGNKDIANLCDVQTLEVEVRNVKNPNLTNILAGIKLPPNATYVTGSAEIAYPSNTYVAATGVTLTGTDSLSIDISADVDMANACGLVGPDDADFVTPANLNNNSAPSVFKFKFDIDFNACPTTATDIVSYNVRAENYCGTEVVTSGIFNLIYVGNAPTNTFTIAAQNNDPLMVCADAGVPNIMMDSLIITNETGPVTSGTSNIMEITLGADTTNFTLSNFSVAAPWTAPTTTVNAEGRTILTFVIPPGIPVGGTQLMELSYVLTPKVDDVCGLAGGPCADISYSTNFYSEVTVDCAAKSLTCASLGQVSRGSGNVPRTLECCKQGLGDYVWLDSNMMVFKILVKVQ